MTFTHVALLVLATVLSLNAVRFSRERRRLHNLNAALTAELERSTAAVVAASKVVAVAIEDESGFAAFSERVMRGPDQPGMILFVKLYANDVRIHRARRSSFHIPPTEVGAIVTQFLARADAPGGIVPEG